ncbi:uncharacterized protein LOC123880565 isoform X2 [Maniola jurtina]|uniref:uncharacterized protein LOC123880565 isoform X2 n=1 Tax=Maniola jurtina TaxID=191418 RepID=UPI001E68F36A|nr:uncharacterized protein LOC123880565 isoform X2 [Maniola jurtina]
MESTEVYIKNLEACKYRNLQQIAKTLSLPSNFKRVDLIELIAKKYKSEAEVQNIIDRVRQERLNQSKGKKRSRGRPKKTKAQGQAQKTLAARNVVSHSPPISVTPKRLSPYRHDSPDILAITPINPKRNLLDTINPHNRNPNVAATDRVLRSYSLQSERPNYALTSGIQGWKTQCCSSTNTELKVIEQTTKGYLRKRKADDDLLKQNFLVSNGGEPDQAIVPAKRQRIYPAQSQVDYEKTQEKQLKDQRNVPLPKTCDDFQRFSYMRDPTQPIYVQGGSKTLYNVPSDPTHVDRSTIDTSPEPLFNMQTKTPLQQSNVNNTSLDFTVQTVPTAAATGLGAMRSKNVRFELFVKCHAEYDVQLIRDVRGCARGRRPRLRLHGEYWYVRTSQLRVLRLGRIHTFARWPYSK